MLDWLGSFITEIISGVMTAIIVLLIQRYLKKNPDKLINLFRINGKQIWKNVLNTSLIIVSVLIVFIAIFNIVTIIKNNLFEDEEIFTLTAEAVAKGDSLVKADTLIISESHDVTGVRETFKTFESLMLRITTRFKDIELEHHETFNFSEAEVIYIYSLKESGPQFIRALQEVNDHALTPAFKALKYQYLAFTSAILCEVIFNEEKRNTYVDSSKQYLENAFSIIDTVDIRRHIENTEYNYSGCWNYFNDFDVINVLYYIKAWIYAFEVKNGLQERSCTEVRRVWRNIDEAFTTINPPGSNPSLKVCF